MVTLDTVFELLTDERRRYALYYLSEQSGPVTVEELGATITEWEENPPELGDASSTFEDVIIELKHTHLPKSAEVDFIQYDPEQNVVQVQGAPREFDAFVSIAQLIEKPDE
ncbi:DUF7344 domain-containing protein [Haloferacaceae archaeon DSL9]